MLEIEELEVSYGGLPALRGVSLRAAEGAFVAIVGPNGAGKTTLFKTISGTVSPRAGRIRFDGRDLLAIRPAARPHLGIAHVPEGRQVFPSLTVRENLEMGAIPATGRRDWQTNLARVEAWFPILAERRSQLAGTLSGGQQQMLAMGMALMTRPTILLLDEPTTGLAPIVVQGMFTSLREINRTTGAAIVMVEQNVAATLRMVDRAIVLKTGRLIFDGSSAELQAHEDLWSWF